MPFRRATVSEEPTVKKRQTMEQAPNGRRAPSHPLVSLQAHVGNRGIARMLAQRAGDPALDEEDMEGGGAKHDPALAQRADDPALDEEDMEGGGAKHDPALAQRLGDEDEMGLKRDNAPTVGLEGGAVGDGIERAIDGSRGAGSSLSPSIQGKMEGAMGVDFSGVRVHHDDTSDRVSRDLTAKAFTTGSDIFLRKDQNPNDQSLLAHELTHVVQQGSGRSSGGNGALTVGAAEHPDEHEADAVATAVTSGGSVERRFDEKAR